MVMGNGEVDDLSKLAYLDEEKLIQELCIRYKNGHIYVGLIFFLFFFHSSLCLNQLVYRLI